jgi:two-component system nitrate/nitrite sensor histidine kinase NarX
MLVQYDRMLKNLEYEVVVRERTRLAREIHDGLAQTLAYLKLQTGQMHSHLSKGDFGRLDQHIQANYQAISEAYNEVRQAIDDLRLTPHFGGKEWFTRITGDFSRATDIKVTQIIAPQIYELSDEIQVQLIRIVQECLSNIRKHAHASHVWLKVKLVEGDLVLEVRDDGRGFEQGNDDALQSHGLRGMRERAEMIGAELRVTSRIGTGTTISLQLPLGMEEVIV